MKSMIDKGDSYEKTKEKNPSINEDDYLELKIKCESNASAESSQWGKDMRNLNLGVPSKAYCPSSINTVTSRQGTMSGPGTRLTR